MAAEVHPVGTFGSSEAQENPVLKDLSLDQLQKLVEWPSEMEKVIEAEQATQPLPFPEQIRPAQNDAPAPPEPAVEAVQAEEPQKSEEPKQEDIEKELLRAQIEAVEAHAKKMEAKLVGREAGERGYIEQLKARIKKLEAGVSPEQEQADVYREEPVQEAVVPQRDGLKAWVTQKAAQEAVAGFLQTHPDMAELEQDTAKYLQDSGFNALNIINMDDPMAASREMTRALDEAYWHVKEARTRSRISELQTKKADQVRGLEEAKRKATSSASGGTPPPQAPAKGLKDLSLAELEAKVKALSGR